MPDLFLDLPWIEADQKIGNVTLHRRELNALRYEDGIELAVEVAEPSDFDDVDQLLGSVERLRGPGRVVLVAGVVPLAWRSRLRRAAVSFVDPSGVAEITWPRLRVSSGQFARNTVRSRAALPLQKSHAVAAQELVTAALNGERLTVGQLAERAAVGLSSASRAVAQLEGHGLIEKQRYGRSVYVAVPDASAVAELLAQRTAWPQGRMLSAFAWGRNIWEVAASISRRAQDVDVGLSLTGGAALAFFGVLSTAQPAAARCWVRAHDHELDAVAELLELEPAPANESNVMLAADPWGVGLVGSAIRTFERSEANIASPVRVWCDVQGERRGSEFAAQLWKEIDHRGRSSDGQ